MNNNEILKKINDCLKESEIPSEEVMAISSLDLVSLAVKLEKAFNVRFTLDEINEDNFSSVDKIQTLVSKKLN